MPSSRGSSQPRDRTCVSCIAGRFFTHQATWEAPMKEKLFCMVQVPKKNSVANLRELGASSGLFAVFAAGLGEARIK